MPESSSTKTLILAFSGGLDTSYCVIYLKEQGYDVITATVNTGGFTEDELDEIAKQSERLGATKHVVVDARQELYDQIISYLIKGNILRGGVYPLCAGAERYIIAEKIVEIAQAENAAFAAHGSTGAGNDQIRLDVAFRVLMPELTVLTPIRELEITRETEIEYLTERGIEVSAESKEYSINQGIIGTTIGGKETTGSWESPPDSVYPGITPIAKTPDTPDRFVLSFTNGLPTALDQTPMSGLAILSELAKRGGHHGVGKSIHLGDTILGIKGRVAFAAPAMLIAIRAHRELEKLVHTRMQAFWKQSLAEVYGSGIHEAQYYDPAMRDIEQFIDSTQQRVTGDVQVQLFKGNIIIEGCKGPYSLLDRKVATYGEENVLWTGQDAVGFGKIYGVQSALAQKAARLAKEAKP
jgi:argininosuccinate synthase